MGYIRGLDQVLEHNCHLAIDIVRQRGICWHGTLRLLLEGLVPPILAEGGQFLVEDVGGHDGVDDNLTEAAFEFGLVGVDAISQLFKVAFHQRVPRNIDRVLFGYALVVVDTSQFSILLGKLTVRDSTMIDVVNEGGKCPRKMKNQRV